MDNTTVTALKDIVDKHTKKDGFIENPLDVFDSYTYTLEWFVCDRKATREFQLYEAFKMKDIVEDAWPGPKNNYITIARTGVTTEFTITDLSIESIGVGNADYSKIAGTADKLSFTVTQVGNTSLADTIQNVVALCGFSSIVDAEYFIKINFVGHSETNPEKYKIAQTKVIPFKITQYQNLSTTTDARGTTTVISGQVPADKVVMDNDVSKTQHGFDYEPVGTLKVALDNFFIKLNESIVSNDLTLDKKMKHTYGYTFSPQILRKNWHTGTMPEEYSLSRQFNKNMKKEPGTQNQSPAGEHIGTGNHIYAIVEELCNASKLIKEEIKKDNPGLTKVIKITPHLVIKTEGYNPVKGTQAYDVQFYIDFEQKVVVQNMPDHLNKIRESKAIVQSIFDSGHVNKKYDYLFTGNNDQILDFNISLDAELTKIFSSPDDIWAYDHFKAGNTSVVLDKHHQELVDKAASSFKKSNDAYEKQKTVVETEQKAYEDMQNKYRALVIAELIKRDGGGPASSMADLDDYYGSMSWEELMIEGNISDDVPVTAADFTDIRTKNVKLQVARANEGKNWDIGDLKVGNMTENLKKLKAKIEKLQEDLAKKNITQAEFKEALNETYSGAVATMLNNELNLNYHDIGSKVFTDIKETEPNSKNLILAEELGSDIMNRLSNEDMQIILKAQASNPVTFRRLIQGMGSMHHKQVTLSEGEETEIALAREKYYEAKGGKLSMVYANMTIKGDPFWLEGYMPPEKKNEFFNHKGTSLQLSNIHTNTNGFPHLILNSGIAKGVDENENVMTRTLVYSLYAVRTVSSSFSNGIFTQTLGMVKNVYADRFPSEAGEKVGMVEVDGDTNFYPDRILRLPPVEDTEALLPIYNKEELYNLEMGFNADGSNPNYHGSLKDQHGTGLIYKGRVLTPFEEQMMEAMKSYGQRTGIGQEPITTAPENWFHDNTEQYVDEQVKTTDETITAQSGMVGHFNPSLDAITRNVLAHQTLDQMPALYNICKAEQKRGQMPFNSCDTIKETDKKMLESLGLTIEDQGKASTVTAMNNQINSWIANDGITFSDEEIAVYQIAAGGELNITGHDPDDIQKLVKRATGERTPEIILEEQASGISTENYYTESGVADNRILNGSKPLNAEVIEATAINTTIIEPYQNSDGSIKTDEDFEAEYEAIQADTTCVGACRTTKVLKLTNVQNDAWIAQANLDKIKEAKVDKIVNESCPTGTESKMNIKKRKFECAPILPGKLTDNELNDVEVLKEGVNKTLEENYYSESGIAEEMAWKANAVELIETELNNNDLVISDEDKTALKLAAAAQINNTIALQELSDNDYRKIQGYETGIKTVIATAQDGHRGDLTNAVTVGKLQHELETLTADVTASNTKLDGYYFDSTFREVEVKTLEELELQVAVADLSLPSEKITEVATIIDSGVTTLVPIDNPVEQIDVDKAPILIKSGVNTMDVILPGSLKSRYSGEGISWNYAMSNPEKVSQYNEAKKIYQILVSSDFGDMTTVTDDAGNNIKVKDFSNIGPITYTDANGVSQTISNPSTFFGIHTTTYNDMNPAYLRDYDDLKGKVADLFPDIESGQKSQLIDGKLPRDSNGILTITISGDKFYIDK